MMLKEFPRLGTKRYDGVTSAGLPVYVYPMPGFQTKYAFFAVDYGGCDRRFQVSGRWQETPAGIAHFLEHKMFDMPDGSAMDRLSALGASPNAYTGYGMTGYLFSCTGHFRECLEELLRMVTTPCFTPESVQKEQGIIGQEIDMGEDDPSRRVYQNLFRALYREHPVRETIVGTRASIGEITADTLLACHRSFYIPKNMVLCCAGDIDPALVMDLAEKLVPPGGEVPARDYGGEEGAIPCAVRVEEKMAVSMPLFELGSKLPCGQTGEAWARELILADLGCEWLLGRGSPLYADMYDAGLINQSFYAGCYDFPRGALCYAGGRSKDPGAVLGRIADAAEAFRLDKAASQRLERLKKARLGGFLLSLDAPEDLPDLQAESHFGLWERMDFPRLVEGIRGEEALDFLRAAFSPERLALSVIHPID